MKAILAQSQSKAMTLGQPASVALHIARVRVRLACGRLVVLAQCAAAAQGPDT